MNGELMAVIGVLFILSVVVQIVGAWWTWCNWNRFADNLSESITHRLRDEGFLRTDQKERKS